MATFTDIYYYANNLSQQIPYRFGNGYAFNPLLCIIEVTYICNLRCDFCQFFQFQDGPRDWGPLKEELTTPEIKRIIDEAPGQLMTFTGGEVTIHPDCREFMQYASERRRFHFVTNAVKINTDFARHLVDMGCSHTLSPAGLFAFEVSIHGLAEVHDEIAKIRNSYVKAVKAVEDVMEFRRLAGKKHPVVNIKMVVTEKNYHQIADLYREMAKLGVDSFNIMAKQNIDAHYYRFKKVDPAESAKKPRPMLLLDRKVLNEQLTEIHRLAKEPGAPYIRYTPTAMNQAEFVKYYTGEINLRDYHCMAPWSKVFISSFGNIYSCPFVELGNIRRNSIQEVWNNEVSRKFRKDLRANQIFEGCLGCCNMELNRSAAGN